MNATTELTKRQVEILDCICYHVAQNGCMPTIREIGESVNIKNPNGVMCHLRALETKGFITRGDGRKARTMKIAGQPTTLEELEDLRDAIRLMIGRASNVPWKDVPMSEVTAYVDEIRRLKKMYSEPVEPERVPENGAQHVSE